MLRLQQYLQCHGRHNNVDKKQTRDACSSKTKESKQKSAKMKIGRFAIARYKKEMKQTLLNDDAGGGHLDNRQRGRVRIINTGGGGGCGGGGGDGRGGDGGHGATGCTGGRRGAGATHGTGVAEALGAVVLLRAVEEAQVELTSGVERHFRREGVRRRGAAQTRAQRLIEFENVHCTGIERTYERSRRRRRRRRTAWCTSRLLAMLPPAAFNIRARAPLDSCLDDGPASRR